MMQSLILMHISLDSADIKEFNPDPAIHLWQQAVVCGRGRRPTQKIWKKVKAKETRNESRSDVEYDESKYSEDSQSDPESSNEPSNSNEEYHEMEINSDGLDLFNSGSSEESDFEGFHI